MNFIQNTFNAMKRSPVLPAILCAVAAAVFPDAVLAQFYNGPGIIGGLSQAEQVGGVANTDIRATVLNILLTVLLYMGLAAVVVIVIAGIWLVVSVGDESAKDKAKKIIGYAVAGLIVIALAAAIVLIVINAVGGTSLFGDVPTLGGLSGDPREIVMGIVYGILLYMGLAAVVVIVIAGIYMVISLGDEQAVGRAKRIILYAIIGLIVIALAGAIVMIIAKATGAEGIFGDIPNTGGSGTATDPRQSVTDILYGVLGYMALVAVIVIVIAGIWMVVSLGDEQAVARAKRIILYAIIGLLVILLSSAIVGIISAAAKPSS